MSQQSKRELLTALRPRYRKATRTEKGAILDELVATTGYHRKYAVQLLNHPPRRRQGQRQASWRKYTSDVVIALEKVWRVANCICGKRLVPFLPEMVEVMERHGEIDLEERTRALLLQISPATADRLLRPARRKEGRRHGLSTTKPGTLLKQSIPVRTFAEWEDAKPGFMEVDLVAHGGDSARGEYLHSLNMVDVATRWSECLAIVNRSQISVGTAIVTVRQRLPFPLLGLDSDNGSEFINANLKRYCEQEQITFTRSRPYRKNDQAYVEQKNWTVVRQLVGYDRYEGQAACDRLNQLYETTRLYVNFFQPVMVLLEKERHGAKVRKRYERAKTPYQRVLASPDVEEEGKAQLRQQYQTLNPAALLRQIEAQQAALWKLAITRTPAYNGENGSNDGQHGPSVKQPDDGIPIKSKVLP